MENPAGYCDLFTIGHAVDNDVFLKMENPAGYCDFFLSVFILFCFKSS